MPKAWFVALASLSKAATPDRLKQNAISEQLIYPPTIYKRKMTNIFYMATGFHGFHVFVGTVFLAVCLYRLHALHFTSKHHFGFEAAAWYWHFVDVVWLFLFIAVYAWGGL
jgi:heme/copper-type cytochrome/quinol oxidase subunit 3